MVDKQNKQKRKQFLPYRLNVLFVLVFLFFSILILRLGVVQIVQGEQYLQQVERSDEVVVRNPVPRGKMYDRNGTLLVDNEPSYTITYTKMNIHTNQYDTLALAEKLATYISIGKEQLKRISERDKKDYWLLTRSDKAMAKLTDKEKKELANKDVYSTIIKRITENDLALISEDELEIIYIKRELDSGYAYAPQPVKNNVPFEEVAVISEHLAQLPGIDIEMNSEGKRKYVQGNQLKSFFGNIKQIPIEQLQYYEVRGYNRNDLVGRSFIEAYYEDVLRGKKEEEYFLIDKTGNVIEKTNLKPGKRGYDLVLTFDNDLQMAVEKILEEELTKGINNPKNPYLKEAFVVMMDPNTGEVLSLAGKKFSNGSFRDVSLGTVTKAFEMGSTVKGATVLTGYETGVIKPGQVLLDAPLIFPGDKSKKGSHKNMGNINDYTALEWSSNVYMFKIAMGIAQYDLANDVQKVSNEEAYRTMRNHFHQFGLGVKTEIDLPMEATGYEGPVSRVTNLLHYSIGQYDTYTPLQLTQYISTIANGGYRMKPYLVKEIRESSAELNYDKIIHQTEPTVLNRIEMSEEYIKRVQHGFWLVMHGHPGRATARYHFVNKPYNPAGKTGTAEVSVRDEKTGAYLRDENGDPIPSVNSTLVGYAPYENPEIAFTVVVPYAESGAVNKNIGSRILDAYFELKKQRGAK